MTLHDTVIVYDSLWYSTLWYYMILYLLDLDWILNAPANISLQQPTESPGVLGYLLELLQESLGCHGRLRSGDGAVGRDSRLPPYVGECNLVAHAQTNWRLTIVLVKVESTTIFQNNT